MSDYIDVIEGLPEEMRLPLLRLAERIEERMRNQFAVTRADISSLREAIEKLAEAQRRTEERVNELAEAQRRTEERVSELAEAQRRTEERVNELAEAQRRTEERVNELAEAQRRTEERVERLERVVEELAEAQRRTEGTLAELIRMHKEFERTFTVKLGALGARWGVGSETAFREGLRGILRDMGLEVRRYLAYDEKGEVFGSPDQVEVDVVIKDGKVCLVEIKSSLSRGDVATFARKVKFYEEREGVRVDRKVVISPFLEPGTKEMAERFGIEVYTEPEGL